MLSYPVTVPRHTYRGSNPQKRERSQNYNRVAQMIEDHINQDLTKAKDDVIQIYLNYDVASKLREDPKLVADIVYGMDAGSNGVTVVKGDFQRAIDKAQKE